jgi:CRISPR-associated protein Cmr2
MRLRRSAVCADAPALRRAQARGREGGIAEQGEPAYRSSLTRAVDRLVVFGVRGRGGHVTADWDDLLRVFLHDPPDKALRVGGGVRVPNHAQRSVQYLKAAGVDASGKGLKRLAGGADQLAAIAERLPLPNAHHVNAGPDGILTVFHPLEATQVPTGGPIDQAGVEPVFSEIGKGLTDPQQRFLALWRLLPERLNGRIGPWFTRLPAETRVPDHTIWHHLDITAGLYAADFEGPKPEDWRTSGGAFLSFHLGPVQPFVAAARSVRDLWTGSAILSWLTFRAMLPIIETLGPTALVFPSLRGAPLMDLWLRHQGLAHLFPDGPTAVTAPSIPNRFLAVVPWGNEGVEAKGLATACEGAAWQAWRELAFAVRAKLEPHLSAQCSRWDVRWHDQIESYFDVRTSLLPVRQASDGAMAGLLGAKTFDEAWPNAAKVRALNDGIPKEARPNYEQKDAGRWQAQVEMAGRLMEASRAIRHVPPSTPPSDDGRYPNKCTLFGSYEQMGPDDLDDSASFWKEARKNLNVGGVRLGSRDRFSAVALAKRFAAPAFLAEALGLEADDLRIPDTWTVAAAPWLKRAGLDWTACRGDGGQRWNGQWLHWRTRHDDADEDRVPDQTWKNIEAARQRSGAPPPVYYAVLKMDADEIGGWLRGEKAPTVREILHPKTRAYFEGLDENDTVQVGLDARRPVGPALHAAISEALANFAVHVVPQVVAKHAGWVIYAGGDDVLALLPVETVLCCAWELRQAFSGLPPVNGWADRGYWRDATGCERLMMGPRASLSAGIAVLHAKDDLREGLEMARQAEQAAKAGGRDAFVLTVQRRSGGRDPALGDWSTAAWLDDLRTRFTAGASDRWLYRLMDEAPTLDALPVAATRAEVRRQVDRSEEATRRLLGHGDEDKAGERIALALDGYRAMAMSPARPAGGAGAATDGRVLHDFLTLCQAASFLARGRD